MADIRAAITRCLRYASHLDTADGHLADMAVDAIAQVATRDA
jgi:hypothetical protein